MVMFIGSMCALGAVGGAIHLLEALNKKHNKDKTNHAYPLNTQQR